MPAQSETGTDFSTLPLEFLCLAVCLGVLLAGCLPHWRVEEIHDPAKRDSSFLKYNFWRYCEGNQQKAKCGLMFLHAFKNPHILASQILLTVGLAATVVSVVLIPYNSGVGPRSGRQSVEIWSAICSAVAGGSLFLGFAIFAMYEQDHLSIYFFAPTFSWFLYIFLYPFMTMRHQRRMKLKIS